MATTDQRDKLRKYLLDQQERRARMDDPAYRQNVNDSAMRSYDSDSRNNLGALLMKSAGQIGAVGGKVADASPVEDFAAAQGKSNAGFQNRLAAEDDNREKRYGVDAKVYEYLADKEQKQSDTESATSRFNSKLKQDKELADQKTKSDADKTAQEMGLKRQELDLKRQELAQKKASEKAEFAALPKEAQVEITTLATKNANKRSIANQMKSYLAQYQTATTKDGKIRIGNQMLKVLNSPEGADAIGSDEANRLGAALKMQVFNVTNPGPMFGRDLKGFNDQVVATINSVENGVKMNDDRIAELRGQPGTSNVAGPNMTPTSEQPKAPAGSAVAAPTAPAPKPTAQMSDAELDAELEALRNGK